MICPPPQYHATTNSNLETAGNYEIISERAQTVLALRSTTTSARKLKKKKRI